MAAEEQDIATWARSEDLSDQTISALKENGITSMKKLRKMNDNYIKKLNLPDMEEDILREGIEKEKKKEELREIPEDFRDFLKGKGILEDGILALKRIGYITKQQLKDLKVKEIDKLNLLDGQKKAIKTIITDLNNNTGIELARAGGVYAESVNFVAKGIKGEAGLVRKTGGGAGYVLGQAKATIEGVEKGGQAIAFKTTASFDDPEKNPEKEVEESMEQ